MTLADLKAEIADDIDDTTGEYTDQIVKAIQGAQRYCERYTFYFNETREITFPTVVGQEWYGAADNANIPTLVHIRDVYREDSAGQRMTMQRLSPEEMELLLFNGAVTGQPSCWTYFEQKIRLYPVPNSTLDTIRMIVAPYRLGVLSADGATNAWLTEAYDMIKARAKYLIQKDTLKDPALAAEALNDYNDQFDALKAETSKRLGTGYFVPTQW